MGIDESRSPLTRRDVVKGAVAATLGAGSMLAGRDALALAASANRTAGDGEIASRPRRHHRCRCGRRGRRVLPRRSVRRRPVRGAIQDRWSLRLARDRLPRPPDHGRCRRPVLPPRHASHLRHAAGAGGPLRPCPARERRHAGGPRQPVHLPNPRRPADLLVVASARHAAARARVRQLHAACAACGAVQDVVGDDRRSVGARPVRQPIVQGRRRVSVDHGADRVSPGRCAPGIGAVDSADGRAGVSGRPDSGSEHLQLGDRPTGQSPAVCWIAVHACG